MWACDLRALWSLALGYCTWTAGLLTKSHLTLGALIHGGPPKRVLVGGRKKVCCTPDPEVSTLISLQSVHMPCPFPSPTSQRTNFTKYSGKVKTGFPSLEPRSGSLLIMKTVITNSLRRTYHKLHWKARSSFEACSKQQYFCYTFLVKYFLPLIFNLDIIKTAPEIYFKNLTLTFQQKKWPYHFTGAAIIRQDTRILFLPQ